jgi:DNA polymerase III subunit delta'
MAKRDEAEPEIRPPRETNVLFGHAGAEETLLDAYRGGRIPHAWLIGGPPGVGKATLAYRMARFVLAHPEPAAPEVQRATSLEVDGASATAKHVAGGTHGGLLVLERTLNERGVLRTAISVEDARKTVTFFGATAAGGGWRVCIVDTVDELNANSANALLKVVEEPPPRSLFLLLSNSPARVLATIQSRCRKLVLRPLATAEVIRAVAAATGQPENAPPLRQAAEASEGSVGRALMLLGGSALGLQERTTQLLKSLPNVDPKALHALGDALAGNDRTTLAAFVDTVERWLIERLGNGSNANLASLARVSEVWEKVLRDARDTQEYNLERKPLVFSVFGMLAEAMRMR